MTVSPGLANRRLFEESLERETARSSRLGTPLSLLILDVDHFKQINDTYGHPAGDAVLRDIGAAVAGGTKAFDVAARYGGDEFVVLLPGCNAIDASGVADRVRAEIAHRVSDAPVTVSVGVATMPDNAADAERLVAAADGALYEAKRSGRDRDPRVDPYRRGCGLRAGAVARSARPWRVGPGSSESSQGESVSIRSGRSHFGHLSASGAHVNQSDPRQSDPHRPRRTLAVILGTLALAGLAVASFGSFAGAADDTAPSTTAPDGTARPHPQLTDAQKQCLADHGVTLPQ